MLGFSIMNIGLLTTHKIKDKIEEQKLQKAAQEKGCNIDVLNVLECSISISPDDSKIYYNDETIENKYDVIIPRIDMPFIEYGLTILQQFEALGVCVTDNASSIQAGHNKLKTMQSFIAKDIPFPTTGYAHSKEDFDQILETVGGVPLVAKLLEGTEGVGIFLADDLKHAHNILKTFKQLSAPVMVQDFIKESSGTDIRSFVIDGKVVASMERHSSDGDFRANVSLGGSSMETHLSKEEEDIVLRATEALGMNIAGVDFMRSSNGPLIIEINTAPDFSGSYGLDEVTGVDVAGQIIDFAVEQFRRLKSVQGGKKQDAAPFVKPIAA